MNLESVIAGWLNETLGGDNQIRLQSREVCRGAALADDLFGAYLYGFHHDTQDFIVAVSVDNVIAARFAADKMQQDPAVLAEAPQLFLQLLLEAPAAKLSGSVATAFDMVGEEGELPDATAFESLDVEGNCLVVYYLCDFDGQAVRIGVALKLDKVIAIAIGGEDGIANTPGEEAGKAPNLSEPRVQNSTVELQIVIDRVPMSIADCARLQAGDVLSLPGTDRSKLKVAAKTIDGAVDIAAGELGVWKHQRAVKLKSEIDPDFIREVAAS